MIAMKVRYLMTSVLVMAAAQFSQSTKSETLTLFDFTNTTSVDNWIEVSDTKRDIGKSKATLILQKTQLFQKAIFFTLLNPLPNGACFAGMTAPLHKDLSNYKHIIMRCKAQGENNQYKIVLHDEGPIGEDRVAYENFFKLPVSNNNTFTDVKLALAEFEPYFRGKKQPDARPLNLTHVTSFGIQMFGGVYSDFKQSGASALTIDHISVSS